MIIRVFWCLGELDYEKQTLHQLKILATDRAKQGRVNTGTAALLIKVQDVEDQPPEFVRVQPVARISEDTPIGTSILQGTTLSFFQVLFTLPLIDHYVNNEQFWRWTEIEASTIQSCIH